MIDAKQKAIYRQQIDYVRNSGLTVDARPVESTVEIKNQDGSTLIYLQGHQADTFCSHARSLWYSAGSMSRDECNAVMAYPYSDAEIHW